jgi:hypothetical protein
MLDAMDSATNQMVSSSAQRVGAGLSLLFAPGERPDVDALRAALEGCQTRAAIVHADEPCGTADVIISGLVFEVDGLASSPSQVDAETAIRIVPGHALSGGVSLAPVTRALLALAAELAVSLPAQVVRWHPAATTIHAQAFSRSVLAWLAGGAFPAPGLVALTRLADGSIVSSGLAHFAGQEMTLRGEHDDHAVRLAALVVDEAVRNGAPLTFTQWRLRDMLLNVEPAREAKHFLVWRAQ